MKSLTAVRWLPGQMAWKRLRGRVRKLVLRVLLMLGELIPTVPARWVADLWFSVPPPRGTEAEWPAGTPFEVESQGCVIRGHLWGNGPVVYLVHGWASQGEDMSAFVEPLVSRGFRVVVFDGPSHGRSDPGPSGPRQSNGMEFARALGAVARLYGPAHAVIAHSLGAMATMLAMRFEPLSAERLVFLAPMPDVPGYLNKLCSAVGLGPRARRRLDALIEERVGRAIDDFRLVQMIEFAAPAQLLVVHDRDDRQTPYETAVSLVHGWPGATLLTTEGLGHRRVLEDPDVVAAITRFVASPTEVPVSGPASPDVRP